MNEQEIEQKHKDKIKAEIKHFGELCCPFGYLDVENAIGICMEIDLSTEEFYDILDNYESDTGIKFNDLDINYCLLEHILQHARNHINNVIDIDICNDTDVYTYGNYLCSDYDSTTELVDRLEEHFKDIKDNEEKQEQLQELRDDVMTDWFLYKINFTLDNE